MGSRSIETDIHVMFRGVVLVFILDVSMLFSVMVVARCMTCL